MTRSPSYAVAMFALLALTSWQMGVAFAEPAPAEAPATPGRDLPITAAPPRSGANSFTRAQAQVRLSDRGYDGIADLSQDGNGVWWARARRDGRPVMVWLDFKGRTGEALSQHGSATGGR
ncbi:hypothetical protein [Rhizosaccharibacter radicis]|uniref:PepSY domain-containing protein n=1 Tax=Rhizosaccharibacter radicis TaxID=2782605 RepID=A0ABT1VYD6_9PROT|nr:hypothetical protein [Acetobacteraceae bacterium KSS12]